MPLYTVSIYRGGKEEEALSRKQLQHRSLVQEQRRVVEAKVGVVVELERQRAERLALRRCRSECERIEISIIMPGVASYWHWAAAVAHKVMKVQVFNLEAHLMSPAHHHDTQI